MKILLSTLFLIISAAAGFNQPDAKKESIFDLMHHGEVLKMDIELDIGFLMDNKNTVNYQDVKVKFRDNQGKRQKWDAEIRTRGRFRRKVCTFPPIKIKFDKDVLRARNLKKHNELKLVTHCLDDYEGKENLLREFLIYKLYEKISPVHYRAQLVQIKYINTPDRSKAKHYGIMLEDEKELASRYDSDLCEDCFNQPVESFDQENMNILSVFQYMIGNSDWSITMLRNVKLLEDEVTGKFSVAPYDFDFSGLVNASYAVADQSLGIRSVRERAFLGLTESREELEPTFQYFLGKKEEIMTTIAEYDLLNKSSREDIQEYIESFFREIEQGR